MNFERRTLRLWLGFLLVVALAVAMVPMVSSPAEAASGDAADEMFFYRDDGLFRYYNISPDGSLGKPMLAGDGYTSGWSSITAVDLDGDGQDEMFFYRDDGLFRYYNISPDGSLGKPMLAGDGYTSGWSSITAVNLDGNVPPPPPTTTTTTKPIPPNPGDSKNCSDFATWRQAQDWFELYYPHYGDVADLDRDNNLIACESLPGAP